MASKAATAATAGRNDDTVAVVCCGSCLPSRRYRKKQEQRRQALGVIPAAQQQLQDDDNDRESEDSQYFFDAVQEPLKDDEYPVVFYSHVKPKPHEFDWDDPATLLGKDSKGKRDEEQVEERAVALVEEEEQFGSQRLTKILRRTTMEHKAFLEAPRIKIGGSGYPGELSVDELAECVSISVFYNGRWYLWSLVDSHRQSYLSSHAQPMFSSNS
jgi:hypothetical protein